MGNINSMGELFTRGHKRTQEDTRHNNRKKAKVEKMSKQSSLANCIVRDSCMGFSERLKGELEYKGMLVKELAGATGISRKTIDNYLLTNGTMPSADNAVAIAQTLGVTVDYLVTGREILHTNNKVSRKPLSPEMRAIAESIEPLSKEERQVVLKTVTELVRLLGKPITGVPVALTPLQKVFLRLFR